MNKREQIETANELAIRTQDDPGLQVELYELTKLVAYKQFAKLKIDVDDYPGLAWMALDKAISQWKVSKGGDFPYYLSMKAFDLGQKTTKKEKFAIALPSGHRVKCEEDKIFEVGSDIADNPDLVKQLSIESYRELNETTTDWAELYNPLQLAYFNDVIVLGGKTTTFCKSNGIKNKEIEALHADVLAIGKEYFTNNNLY